MHNQTGKKFMPHANRGDRGTGIYLIPAPDLEALDAVRVVQVTGVTYHECCERARLCLAFKWVPESAYGSGGTPVGLCARKSCAVAEDCGSNTGCLCWLGYCTSALSEPASPAAGGYAEGYKAKPPKRTRTPNTGR
jgi:hypothetical protein